MSRKEMVRMSPPLNLASEAPACQAQPNQACTIRNPPPFGRNVQESSTPPRSLLQESIFEKLKTGKHVSEKRQKMTRLLTNVTFPHQTNLLSSDKFNLDLVYDKQCEIT